MAWNNFSNPYMPGMNNPYMPGNYMNNMFQTQQPNPLMAQSQMNQIAPQQPVSGLTRVTGMDGAKAYQMPPNSVVALFDDASDIFYVKSTDGAGFPTIRVFDFFEHKQDQVVPQQTMNSENFATKQELQLVQNQIEELKGVLLNAQQPVPEQPAEQQPRTNARNAK